VAPLNEVKEEEASVHADTCAALALAHRQISVAPAPWRKTLSGRPSSKKGKEAVDSMANLARRFASMIAPKPSHTTPLAVTDVPTKLAEVRYKAHPSATIAPKPSRATPRAGSDVPINLAEVCPAAQPLAASPVAPVVGSVNLALRAEGAEQEYCTGISSISEKTYGHWASNAWATSNTWRMRT
jgi:hypothetical protein